MGKPLITHEGYEQLRQDLDYLLNTKRPQVTEKVAWAASLGDRSENADYHYNKRLLGQIDRKIRFLRHRLEELKLVTYNPQQDGRVFFGAYVEIESVKPPETMRVRIVGGDELFGRSNCISVDCPLARALLGHEEGEECVVHTPRGERYWEIRRIAYQLPEWFTEEPVKDNILADDEESGAEPVAEVSAEESARIEQEYLRSLMNHS